MTVSTFNQPNFNTQDVTTYKGSIDASIKVLMEMAANFAAHEAAVPDMTVVVDAGKLWTGGVYLSRVPQVTAVITAPVTDPRIDRLAIDLSTGNVVVIAGAEAPSPVAPAYSSMHYPLCQIALTPSITVVANGDIIDERAVAFSDDTVDGIHANTVATANQLLALDANKRMSPDGIVFPAIAIPSADANTLDDYEEGSWSPVITDGLWNATMNASLTYGTYTKIGDLVHIQCRVATTSLGSISSSIYISGLPFNASGTVADSIGYCAMTVGLCSGFNLVAGQSVAAHIENNNNIMRLSKWSAASGTVSLFAAEYTANGDLVISGTYHAS